MQGLDVIHFPPVIFSQFSSVVFGGLVSGIGQLEQTSDDEQALVEKFIHRPPSTGVVHPTGNGSLTGSRPEWPTIIKRSETHFAASCSFLMPVPEIYQVGGLSVR